MPPEKIDSNNYEQSRRHFLKIITFRCLKTLKNLLVNIVEVAIISVGMSVQDVVLTMLEDKPDRLEDEQDRLEDKPDRLEDEQDRLEDKPDRLEDEQDMLEDEQDRRRQAG